MKSRIVKKILAGCLSIILMLQSIGATTVFALKDTDITSPVPAPFANSSDVTTTFKNVKFTVEQGDNKDIQPGGELNPTDSIKIAVSFDVIDNSIDAGDTACFQLSNGLDIGTAIDGPLEFDGVVVGTINFLLNQTTGITTATVIFSGIVDDPDIQDVKAYFEADMSYNSRGSAGNVGDHTIQIFGKNFTVAVPEKVTRITVTKDGDADVAKEVVNWKVKVDPIIDGGGIGSLNDCVFMDNLSTVGEYVAGSFKIGIQADGTAVPSPDASYDSATKVLTYNFLDTDNDTRYITFQTDIPTENLNESGKQTINNTAGVTTTRADVITIDGIGKAEFERKWIEKSGKANNETAGGIYDPKNQTITWSITANHDGVKLDNAVIIDKLPDGLKWKSATLQTWDSVANAWVTSSTTFTTEPAAGEYSLGNINTKILLTITTKVDDTNPPSEVAKYKNTATIKWNGFAKGHRVTSGDVGVGFAPIKKEAKGYNQSTHEINWSVSVDAQSQNYGTDLRILDLLVYDKEESGFGFNNTYTIDNNGNGNLFDVTVEDIKKLTPQYNQKYVSGSFVDTTTPSALGIVVHTLNNADGKAVADLLVVIKTDGTSIDNTNKNSFTYKSVVTNPEIYASNRIDHPIKNTTSLFTANAIVSSATAIQKYTSEMLFKDMLTVGFTDADVDDPTNLNGKAAAKDKAFNYVDKSIYFRIHVNANGLTDATNDITAVNGEKLGNLTIADTLPKGWEFEQIGGKDFLLFKGTKSVTTGFVDVTQAVDEGDYASIFTGGVPVPPTNTEGGKMAFTFSSLTKPYVILVKAVPTAVTAAGYFNTNGTYTIQNDAYLSANGTKLATDVEEATVKSNIVAKNLNQSNADSQGYLIWNVEYKPYGLAHENAYLEDILPTGIDLRTNSKGELLIENSNITATELVLKSDGTYDVGAALGAAVLKKAITYSPQTRVLGFQIPDTSKTYRLTYITDVTGTTGTVQNKVSLTGGAIPPTGAEGHQDYDITSASAGASFKRSGGLIVTKQSTDGTTLAGAEFTLFAEDGTTIICQGTSGSNGEIYLRVIPEGKYILKETAAPSGYVLDGQRHIVIVTKDVDGKFIISIDNQTGNSSHKITVKNHKTGTLGALMIEKTVSGTAGDTGKSFEFILTLSDATNSYCYIGNGVSDGTIKSGDVILLAHHQSITVMGLPKDTTYTVSEKDYTADGYTVSKSGDSGKIAVDNTQRASFINIKNNKSDGNPDGGDSGSGTPGWGGNPGWGYPGDSNADNSPQKQPEASAPLAEYPTYPVNKIPNPNLPNSPDKITVIDENNAVVGIYTKTAMSDGTFVYINDEGIQLGNSANPQTGNVMPVELLIILFIVSLCSVSALILYKKVRYSK